MGWRMRCPYALRPRCPSPPRPLTGVSRLPRRRTSTCSYGSSGEIYHLFPRKALIDCDAGLLQIWMTEKQIDIPEHDVYFTTGRRNGQTLVVRADRGPALALHALLRRLGVLAGHAGAPECGFHDGVSLVQFPPVGQLRW
jgi:hypothetical protein